MYQRSPLLDDDTTKAIWEYLYLVRMAEIHSMSADYIKACGTYSTGNRETDRVLAKQSFQRWMPIHEMIEYYSKGATIGIVNQSDIPKIYDAIERHINCWGDMVSRGINIGDAPLEDLELMDQFANSLYAHAKYSFTPDSALSHLKRQLEGITRFTPAMLVKPLPKVQAENVSYSGGDVIINQQQDVYPERESLGRLFTDRIIQNYKPKG